MKFSTSLLLSLVASLANAQGQLGFDLGVNTGTDTCKSTSDYEADLDALSGYTSTVKTYSVSDCDTLQVLGPVADEKGFTISLGIWPTPDDKFSTEQQALKDYLPKIKKSTIKAFLVGSEALYRGDLTASELSDHISTIKSLLGDIEDSEGSSYADVPVGTVDSWNVLVDGANSAAIQASDVVYANAFSYWQGQVMSNASYSFFDDIMQALQTIQTTKGSTDIEFWVGETGWPTDGDNFGSSEPSLANAKQFWQEGICAIRGWGINTYVFEAFDESWKPDTSNSNAEKYWGAFGEDRTLKYDLTCDYTS